MIKSPGVCGYEFGTGWLCHQKDYIGTTFVGSWADITPDCFLVKLTDSEDDDRTEQFYTLDLGEFCPSEEFIPVYTFPNSEDCFLTSDLGQLYTSTEYTAFCPKLNYSIPIISLQGGEVPSGDIILDDEEYIEYGAISLSDHGELKVKITNDISSEPGIYSVWYYARDYHGLDITKVRKVTVI